MKMLSPGHLYPPKIKRRVGLDIEKEKTSHFAIPDHLFGVCRSMEDGPDESLYFHDYKELSEDWKRLLEAELTRLASAGYRWTDIYTQCVLRATLLASR